MLLTRRVAKLPGSHRARPARHLPLHRCVSLITLRTAPGRAAPHVGADAPARHLALGRMGFRPFFLLAALFAVAAVPLWLLVLNGRISLESRGGSLLWHSHEMIFGYAVAVIAGFLLTAATRWSGRVTAVGGALYGLAALWLLGRVALLVSSELPGGLVALLDLAFLPALALAVGRALVGAGNRRNYVMLVLLLGLFVANVATHLEMLGWRPGAAAWGTRLALNLVALMMLIIGARVIPMFTRNATRAANVTGSPRWEKATALLMASVIVTDAAGAPAGLRSFLAAATALCAVIAMRTWGFRPALRQPMLWVLHFGYLWIPIALALRSVELAGGPVAASAAIHALTAGAIGTLTLGMMSRVTLGHTGRLIAATPLTTVSFVLITFATLLRVFGPELGVAWLREVWLLSGFAWVLAFAAYALRFGPMLLRPRTDGEDG